MEKKSFLQWIPGIVSETLAVVFCIIYACVDGKSSTMYLELIAAALLPLVVPILSVLTKKPFPIVLSAAFVVFVFGACNLGSALGFYDRFLCWDWIMHGIFGFLCSLTIFILLVRWNGDKLNPVGFFIVIFVFTMGIAALWEVWEYTVDSITGGDSQRVAESIALGKSPLADTMEDIIIAIAGAAAFIVSVIADKFNKYKLYSRLCGFDGFHTSDQKI